MILSEHLGWLEWQLPVLGFRGSGFCCSKESGQVSITSSLRLFDVSQGVNERKRELQIYFNLLCST